MSTRVQRKFVVVSHGRSGSTMLMKRLGGHPDIHVQIELLNPRSVHSLSRWQSRTKRIAALVGVTKERLNLSFDGQNLTAVMNNLVWGRLFRNYGAAGFKIIVGQWSNLLPSQQENLLAVPDLHVILLRREDTLSHMVSLAQAKFHGYKHRMREMPSQEMPPVSITLEELKEFQRRYFVTMKTIEKTFSRFPTISTSYEDLIGNPEREDNRLLDFLGVRRLPLSDLLVKNSSAPLSARISNYAELSDSLRGTAYERLLQSSGNSGA